MIRLLIVLSSAILVACSAQHSRQVAAPTPTRDTPIGTILKQYALQRSYEECKLKNVSTEECQKTIDADEKRLDTVNVRIEALLKDSRTNMCDVVRFVSACGNPIYTLGDLADCLQMTPDREEALNSGRFTLKLDAHGCPTDK